MNPISLAIVLSGHGLQLCLIALLLRKSLWRTYPFFFSIAVWIEVRNLVIPALQTHFPAAYQSYYWKTDVIDVVLRFLIIWEVFRQTFPKGSALAKSLSNGFSGIFYGLAIFAIGTAWTFQTYSQYHSIYPALERSFGFAQAALIMGILLAARYYGVRLGRNVWGIAVAFGGWVSIVTANNAMIDLAHSFLPYWQILWPLSYIAMLSVWTWAVWVYAPNPVITEAELAPNDPQVRAWASDWDRATAAARKAVAP